MRTWIVAVCLCIFCFILPLQCFIIGDNNGLGIQGAVYRWQTTSEGESLIPITCELTYVTGGTYSGKTALMVVLWATGTVVLTLTTIISLIYWNQLPQRYLTLIITGLVTAGVLYLASCIAQYGPLFFGPAGISLPVGVAILFIMAIFLCNYRDFLYDKENNLQTDKN